MKDKTPAKSFRQNLLALWQWLTAQSGSFRLNQDIERRRQSQLLASLLTILIPLGSGVLIIIRSLDSPSTLLSLDANVLLDLVAITSLIMAFFLNRQGYYNSAAWLFVLMCSVVPILLAVPDYVPREVYLLNFLVVPVLLSSLFFSTRLTLLVLALNIIGILLFPLFVPTVTLSGVITDQVGFVLIVSALILMAARHHRLVETDRQVELAERNERLTVTLQSIGDGVITTDTVGRIVLLNAVGEKLTGWTQTEAAGQPLTEVFNVINERTGQVAENPVQKVLASGKLVQLATHTILIGRDGTRRVIDDSAAPIRDQSSGLTLGVVLVFRDITEKQKTEQELLKAHKLESVGLLAGGIAHDFNNILTSVLGNLSLAKLEIENENTKVWELLDEAEKASYRSRHLTQQLLTFSKGGDPIRKTTSLQSLLQEAANFALSGSNVRCDFAISETLWPAEIDEGQIYQVINNLVINAKQAMPDGGTITISAQNISRQEREYNLPLQEIDYVQVMIKDEGVGISEKDLPRIFDPYFTTKEYGSGLGLATSFAIITKHAGYITCRSQPGQGTTFLIFLPARPGLTVSSPVADLPLPTTPVLNNKGRILVIEDEQPIRNLLKKALGQNGYSVDMAEDGAIGLELYRQALARTQPYNLVIMDLTIPGGMGGKEAIVQLRALDPTVKAMVASGYFNDPVMANYRQYGFEAALSKPFLVKELLQKVKEILD